MAIRAGANTVVGPLLFVLVGLGFLLFGVGAIAVGFLQQKGLIQWPTTWPVPASPLIAGGIAFVGLIVTSKATTHLRRAQAILRLRAKLQRVGKPVMGNVTSISPHFIYEFPLPNGRKVQAIFDAAEDSESAGLYLGSAIEILYNPENPEESIWSGR